MCGTSGMYTALSAFAMKGAMASSFCASAALSDTVLVSVFVFLRGVIIRRKAALRLLVSGNAKPMTA